MGFKEKDYAFSLSLNDYFYHSDFPLATSTFMLFFNHKNLCHTGALTSWIFVLSIGYFSYLNISSMRA